jgi:hypothetical protein
MLEMFAAIIWVFLNQAAYYRNKNKQKIIAVRIFCNICIDNGLITWGRVEAQY